MKPIKHFLMIFSLCAAGNIAHTQPKPDELPEAKKPAISDTDLTHFSLKIYSDFVGIGQKDPNGLVQTELSLSFPFVKWKPFKEINLTFFDNISPKANFFQTKTDSSKQNKLLNYGTDPVTNNVIKHIHTLDLIKYSHLSFSAKINVLKFKFKDRFVFYTDLFPVFYRTPVVDTLAGNRAIYNLSSWGMGYSFKLRFKPDDSKFMMDVSYTQFSIKLNNNDIMQRYGKLYESTNAENNKFTGSTSTSAFTLGPGTIGIGSVEFRYSTKYTNVQNTSNEGYFIRATIFTNPLIGAGSSKTDYGNNYVQFQVGLSKSIDEFLKLLKS